MIRFVLSLLVAFSLIGGSPAIAALAVPSAAQASECTMDDGALQGPMDHGKMPCCTSDCTMTGTAGIAEPGGASFTQPPFAKTQHAAALAVRLASLNLTGDDPPPRARPS